MAHPGHLHFEQSNTQMGLPDVLAANSRDAAKVRTANVLNSLTGKIAGFCSARGIPWMIENPRESLMWWHEDLQSLTQQNHVAFVHFQNCAYGGRRPKWTGLLHAPD